MRSPIPSPGRPRTGKSQRHLVFVLGVLLCVGSLAASARIADAIPPQSVAVAAGRVITGSSFDHWMNVWAKQQALQEGPTQPVIVPLYPPLFDDCIRQVRRKFPSFANRSPAPIRADCKKIFRQYTNVVLTYLIDADWYEADAARLGIVYTQADLNKAFEKAKAREFPTRAALASYLKRNGGETLADVQYQIRVNGIYQKLLDTAGGKTKANAELTVSSQISSLYRADTFCKPAYVIDLCSPRTTFADATLLPSDTRRTRRMRQTQNEALVGPSSSGRLRSAIRL
jgi:hypothetical protein